MQVELSRVLQMLTDHRLLTLGRDAASGESVVELAHESLLWAWDRYAGWLERHRAALADRESLLRAVADWEAAGRHPDHLLRGRRLERYTGPGSDAVLTTPRERALLEASLAEREVEADRTANGDGLSPSASPVLRRRGAPARGRRRDRCHRPQPRDRLPSRRAAVP